jgi:hypothetical protein
VLWFVSAAHIPSLSYPRTCPSKERGGGSRTGRSSAVQRPFQLGRWRVRGSQEVIFNTTNPTAHKHTRHALDWAFWGWFWVWDPAQAGRRCEMCECGGFSSSWLYRARLAKSAHGVAPLNLHPPRIGLQPIPACALNRTWPVLLACFSRAPASRASLRGAPVVGCPGGPPIAAGRGLLELQCSARHAAPGQFR